MKHYLLEPLDTLFFGDGSPFNAGETGQMEVLGTFPPSPTTVVGALRAAFARELGWPRNGWNQRIVEALGDGRDLGPLRFSGPYVVKDGDVLFPAPLHLLRSKQSEPEGKVHFMFLKPGGNAFSTDIGEARLPEAEAKRDDSGREITGFKPLGDAYLTREGMEKALRGEPPGPDEVLDGATLWGGEPRVGIRRHPEKRTTEEDALYQITHVRPKKGVALAMGVDGYDGEAPGLLTLGGESRMAGLKSASSFAFPKAPALEPEGGTLRYTATLITPARLREEGWRKPCGELPGLPGKVVSACAGKPLMIGGWDTEKKEPLALEPHLPPGSTWFMEVSADKAEKVRKMHAGHIGERQEWGYGQILIGAWR